MENHYVTIIEEYDSYRLTGSRVSLDSVVYDWLNGLSPEQIVENFQTLNLEQVYGAIAYYLGHREDVDAHMRRTREKYDALVAEARVKYPHLYEKLEAAAEVAV